MQQEPIWLLLLKEKVRLKETGLTIPFIIGTYHQFFNNSISIFDLINEISENDLEQVLLKFCYDTREYILSVSPNLIPGLSYYKTIQFNKLFVVQEKNLKGLDELDFLIQSLELDYVKHIKSKNYSWDGKNWIEFTEKNQSFISQALEFYSKK